MAIKFRQQAIDHNLSRDWGRVVIIQPLSHKLLTTVAVVFMVVLSLILSFGEYSRRVSVNGHLSSDRGTIKIYGPSSAHVLEVLVHKNQSVNHGDPLLHIDKSLGVLAGSDLQSELIGELENELSTLEAQKLNIERKWDLLVQSHKRKIAGYQQEIRILQNQQRLQREIVAISSDRVSSMERITDQALISENQKQVLRENLLNAQMSLTGIEKSISRLTRELQQATAYKSQIPIERSSEIAVIESSLSSVRQRVKELDATRVQVLRAPQSGTVAAIHASVGASTTSSTPLLTLIPEGSTLEAQLYIPSRAIGFIVPGQQVRLKYDSYAYQKYGMADAEILTISNTILSPEEVNAPIVVEEAVYKVVCRIREQTMRGYGKEWPLQDGMTLTAEIILQPRTLAEWLLDPIYSLGRG